ncbi:MAG: hypothetical protein O2865_01180 [Planctomycetota bacterium]|nr:hypothetical protein [Planctomycetota bacterium]MDA0932848.1 hypothetical protein [Planctomycetota bacterium]MDA1220471.1 hypothetical protein [Planctomycetota bacterium]
MPQLQGALAAVALAAAIPAQTVPQLTPFPRVMDLLVVDSTFDGVWRMKDLNQDGDYDDAQEISVYYDDVSGSISLTNPTCIGVSGTGTTYIADSTVDIVVALNDLNGDGDALDPGEHAVFFDASNQSGILMPSAQGLCVDAIGNVYIANSNTSTVGVDAIIKLSDLNGDGDANDFGEAIYYCQIPNSSAVVGDSIPTKVAVGPDGRVYYTDVGATGALVKGVYQLTDFNGDGDADDPGEHSLFWAPTAAGNAFYWGLAITRDGTIYVTDHGNEQVWRGKDLNNDGTIFGAEENLFYQTGGSTWWDVILHPDGRMVLCEDQTPDRLTLLEDFDGNGDAFGLGESYEAYTSGVGSQSVRPRGGAFLRAPTLFVQPSVVGVGQQVTFQVIATRPGDLVGVLLSDILIPAPFSYPPFGYLEVNPQNLTSLFSGIAGPQSLLTTTFPIPNDPGLVGTFAFQAIGANPARLYLSNGVGLTIQ